MCIYIYEYKAPIRAEREKIECKLLKREFCNAVARLVETRSLAGREEHAVGV
jgi:hypothetical protein